jgi:hypothetical protein
MGKTAAIVILSAAVVGLGGYLIYQRRKGAPKPVEGGQAGAVDPTGVLGNFIVNPLGVFTGWGGSPML